MVRGQGSDEESQREEAVVTAVKAKKIWGFQMQACERKECPSLKKVPGTGKLTWQVAMNQLLSLSSSRH